MFLSFKSVLITEVISRLQFFIMCKYNILPTFGEYLCVKRIYVMYNCKKCTINYAHGKTKIIHHISQTEEVKIQSIFYLKQICCVLVIQLFNDYLFSVYYNGLLDTCVMHS